jgi:hypothetical protein
VLWAPVAAADLAIEGGVTRAGVGFMLGSAVLHSFYYGALQSSYRHGDLSVVYPLARGSGPVLSVAAAILFLWHAHAVDALNQPWWSARCSARGCWGRGTWAAGSSRPPRSRWASPRSRSRDVGARCYHSGRPFNQVP